VLLDAGAGKARKYTEATCFIFTRSEGLGVASVHMFELGSKQPYRVDGAKARFYLFGIILTHHLAAGGEADSRANNCSPSSQRRVGIEGHSSLLFNLSKALRASPQFFGHDGRPRNLIGVLGLLLLEPNDYQTGTRGTQSNVEMGHESCLSPHYGLP